MLRPFNVAFTAMPVVLFDARVGLLTGRGDAHLATHMARGRARSLPRSQPPCSSNLMHCNKHWCDGIMLQIRHGAAIS
jgi:hypothetical protein